MEERGEGEKKKEETRRWKAVGMIEVERKARETKMQFLFSLSLSLSSFLKKRGTLTKRTIFIIRERSNDIEECQRKFNRGEGRLSGRRLISNRVLAVFREKRGRKRASVYASGHTWVGGETGVRFDVSTLRSWQRHDNLWN